MPNLDPKNYVVHCKKSRYDVYIGRPSPWGNPWSHKMGTLAEYRVDTRAQAIEAFEKWFRSQPQLMLRAKRELKGKILGCFCSPLACHGEIIAKIANE